MNQPVVPPPRRERELFLEALEQSDPTARQAFLDGACGDDAALRASVDALLACHREDRFLETPVIEWISPGTAMRNAQRTAGEGATSLLEKPGDRIGRYKLLQVIGEGGAGTVFMAEQEEPVRRRVALKVIKPGMDTKSVIARFETERQALAMMDHPNIAAVLDGGATETGRPFFVMELVRGVRITDYCDENNLPTPERLQLFIKTCHAIQHAHQKGIVHRDIKPSNILVTLHDGVPVPKVIDFGIAKAMDQRLTDKTLFTEYQAFIGTPAYMSPEQAEMSGLDIDTRADVYSLGVLLYEMLTGKTPFDAKELLSSGLDGIRRTIREQDPERPSTRLRTMEDAERTTTATRHRTEAARLVSLLSGDLDWIVLKALEKDRTRRYETANALGMDVQRFLDNEPVVARPPTPIYRFRKLVRRNRALFTAGAAFAAALVFGLALALWQYLEKSDAYRQVVVAEHQERELRQEAQKAQSTEAQLRREAQEHELFARRKAYAADMNLVQAALAANNLGRAEELLEQQRPAHGAPDLRGWEWDYLWQRCQSDALFTLCRRTNEIVSLAAAYDGKWVAVSEKDRGITVWDLRARFEVARHPAGNGRAQVAFSPLEPILAFSSAEGSSFTNRQDRIRLWDAAERRFLLDLPIGASCRGLVFSADGRRLLVGTVDGRISLFSITNANPLSTIRVAMRPGPFVAALTATRDLTRIAYPQDEGRLAVVDTATGTELWSATAAEETVTALAFSPDGTRLASGAGFVESAIRLWDVAKGEEIARLEGHRTWVSALVFWPDGETLASASADQTVRLWELANLQPPEPPRDDRWRRFRRPRPGPLATQRELASLRGHKLEVWSLALLPDNATLVSGSKDGSVYVWDSTARRPDTTQFELPDPVRAWRFAPDSRSIYTLGNDGEVVRWAGEDFHDPQPLFAMSEGGFASAFSPDARWVMASSPRTGLEVWQVEQRQRVFELGRDAGPLMPVGFIPGTHHLVVRRFDDGRLQEWNLENRTEVRSWKPPVELGPRATFALAPGGTWWLATGSDGGAWLWNPARNETRPLELGQASQAQIAFAPDGHRFAMVNTLGVGSLWETETSTRLTTLKGFLQSMHAVTFSPDGRRLVIGSDGREALKIWDVESRQELLTLEAPGSKYQSIEFSPDGALLGARNSRGILHLWRARVPNPAAAAPSPL